MTNLVAAALILTASWERLSDQGKLAANGRPFDTNLLTCATWRYPLGSHLRVTDIHNGFSVCVLVTDRPHRRFPNRIDLSPAAFSRLNGLGLGTCVVSVTEKY